MRVNIEQGLNNCPLVYDTYPNNWTNLQHVLDFVAEQRFTQKKTLILADMPHVSEVDEAEAHAQLTQILHKHQIDQFIGIGPKQVAYAATCPFNNMYCFETLSHVLASELLGRLRDAVIIIKGTNDGLLSPIISFLQLKCHDTVLEIDIHAIQHNLHYFQKHIGAGTQIIAMIKAAAYGSGSCLYDIAYLLEQSSVSYLAVAYVDEGVTLRENGIKLPIMVMNPSPSSFTKMLLYHLEPSIYSLRILKAWRDFLKHHAAYSGIHIKLDTGMHRLGFMEEELGELVQILQELPYWSIKSVYSHLAAPGSLHHRAYTHQQATLFQKMVNYLEGQLGTTLPKHLLNTTGTHTLPAYQFDMIRLGIGLYGFSKEIQAHLKSASTLKTIISQIKELPMGTTIGYERKGVAQRATRIATLAIGYADGFRRSLSNGKGKVLVKGQIAPVVGNVCMDMAMVDITDIAAQEGDEVIIFGKELPVADMATAMDTIVYEVLTNVNERVRKVYYKALFI
eukprot:gene353-448_t